MIFQKGDITPTGWEILEVTFRPEYKLKRLIKIVSKSKLPDCNKKFANKIGTLYCEGPFYWIEFDGDTKQYRFRTEEFKYINKTNGKSKRKH